MAPIFVIIIGKVLDYIGEHSGEIVDVIRDEFLKDKPNEKVKEAIDNLGYNPSATNLDALHETLKEGGYDSDKLAAILINKTLV